MEKISSSVFRHLGRLWPGDAPLAVLVNVASLEEEALLVGRVAALEAVGGVEVALRDDAALVGAGEEVLQVEDEDVDEVLALRLAGVGVAVAGDAVVKRGLGGA